MHYATRSSGERSAKPEVDDLAFPSRDAAENKLQTLLEHLSLLWWVLSAYRGDVHPNWSLQNIVCQLCVTTPINPPSRSSWLCTL